MKKTLQECKEIIANEAGFDSWSFMLRFESKETIYFSTDFANKMYYEQSEQIQDDIEEKWKKYRYQTNNEDAWMFKEWLINQFKKK